MTLFGVEFPRSVLSERVSNNIVRDFVRSPVLPMSDRRVVVSLTESYVRFVFCIRMKVPYIASMFGLTVVALAVILSGLSWWIIPGALLVGLDFGLRGRRVLYVLFLVRARIAGYNGKSRFIGYDEVFDILRESHGAA